MANRLTRIITRTGDDGTTGLGDGTRVDKAHPRIRAMGEIDELNSALGVLAAEPLSVASQQIVRRLQNALFDLGGEICIAGHRLLTDAHLRFLDETTAQLNASLPPLKEFILPGGTRAAALCHSARTIARRAERSLAELARDQTAGVSPLALPFLNRCSDLLFVLARTLNRDAGVGDVLWQRDFAAHGGSPD